MLFGAETLVQAHQSPFDTVIAQASFHCQTDVASLRVRPRDAS